MKRKIKLILSLFIVVSITACAKIETTEPVQAKTETIENQYLIDIREITNYQDTEHGLQLNLKNGNSIIHVPVKNVTEYVYPICNIVYHNGEYFVIAMPNGSLHGYIMKDPPEGNLERAFFRTLNQDNYKNYEILNAE